MSEIPDRITDLLRQGRRLDAVKLLSESTGRTLEESNEEIDRILAGLTARGDDPTTMPHDPLPEKVIHLARQGKTIDAIRKLREETGMPLKDAKERIEAIDGAKKGGCLGSVLFIVAAGVLAAVAGWG